MIGGAVKNLSSMTGEKFRYKVCIGDAVLVSFAEFSVNCYVGLHC